LKAFNYCGHCFDLLILLITYTEERGFDLSSSSTEEFLCYLHLFSPPLFIIYSLLIHPIIDNVDELGEQ